MKKKKMNETIMKIGLILAMSVLLICMLAAPASALTPHEPILIIGNDDFTPANGVTGGSGTKSDPFIIEGWDINASTADGIEIRVTDIHFVIRDCVIHDGYDDNEGIRFSDVINGKIENCTIYNNFVGISLVECTPIIEFTDIFFQDDMESGTNGWTHGGDQDEWELGTPSYGPSSAHSGNNCWGTDLDGNYNNNANEWLMSPAIDLSAVSEAYLRFYEWSRVNDGEDHVYVEISTDGGESWVTLDISYSMRYCWTRKICDISSYTGYSDTRIRFRLDSDWEHVYEGLYIDDVAVGNGTLLGNNIITSNQIYYNYLGGIRLSSSSNISISANQIYYNYVCGIHIYDSPPQEVYQGNINVESNRIYNNDCGISLSSSSNTEIHYNDIYASWYYGVENRNSEPQYKADASCNWWGAVDGPGGEGPGSGDEVSGNVIYEPWCPSGECTSAQIYVNTSGWWRPEEQFNPSSTPIQDAVNNAITSCCNIVVKDGSYSENVKVNKLLAIRSENGSTNCVVQAASSDDHMFEVTADYVNISGFTIEGATGEEKAGIYLYGAYHSVVSNNNISNCYYGVRVSALWYCDIVSNIISNCQYGISVK